MLGQPLRPEAILMRMNALDIGMVLQNFAALRLAAQTVLRCRNRAAAMTSGSTPSRRAGIECRPRPNRPRGDGLRTYTLRCDTPIWLARNKCLSCFVGEVTATDTVYTDIGQSRRSQAETSHHGRHSFLMKNSLI